MRFEDWDVLLFPKDSKIPLKEFKTNCYVVHDNEFMYTTGSYGLPTMCCFMPGLSAGQPFNISLHCWNMPEISQYTRNYSKHPEFVRFEARVLIDGRLVASAAFQPHGPWPQLLNHSFDFTRNGELETLRFPPFRSELLMENHWSPADEVGRIKIIISEGFPRDSQTVPIERVKNIIAFSFQHAPIAILESAGIAWPNPQMWRRGSFNSTMPVPTQHLAGGAEAHLHSPRRKPSYMKSHSSSELNSGSADLNGSTFLGSMPNTQSFLRHAPVDSELTSQLASRVDPEDIDEHSQIDWANASFGVGGFAARSHEVDKAARSSAVNFNHRDARKISKSDASMLDYEHAIDFMNAPISSGLNPEDGEASMRDLKVPTNTPTTFTGPSFVDNLCLDVDPDEISHEAPAPKDFFDHPHNTKFSADFAISLTHSLLNQPHPLPAGAAAALNAIVPPLPASEVKSRKERLSVEPSKNNTPAIEHIETRKVSQGIFSVGKDSSRDASTSDSPLSSRAFSGVFSHCSTNAGEFGDSLTNMNSLLQTNSIVNAVPVGQENRVISAVGSSGGASLNQTPSISSGSEKGIKRTRQFTPASAKAIDDEDEPRRSSPKVMNSFGDQLID